MKDQAQHVTSAPGLKAWRHELPHLYDDELDPYQYRMMGHYVRVGECWEGLRTTAKKCKMSLGKAQATRQWLADNGWINMVENDDHIGVTVTPVDRWQENLTKHSKCSPHEQGVHLVNAGCSPGELKNKEGIKRLSTNQEMFQALADVTKLDPAIKRNAGRIGTVSAELIKAEYLPAHITRAYQGDNCWWRRNDWRGKKGQPPTPEQIIATIGEAVKKNGKAVELDPDRATKLRFIQDNPHNPLTAEFKLELGIQGE